MTTRPRQLHLEVSQRTSPDLVHRMVRLKADGEAAGIDVSYEIHDSSVGELPVLDGFVVGVLLHCMRRGLPVRIHGSISASAAYNLHEFQRAWTLLKPNVYQHVDLLPDAVVAVQPRTPKVIQAFSCGVDATFTLLANKQLHRGQGGYDVAAGLLVHGFDVSYENTNSFDILASSARATLNRFAMDLKTVRTNSRQLNIQSWMDSFALQLAACLHQFSNHYSRALLPSAEPYDALSMPISSNPITDPLLSGDLMSIIHDGAGFSRTDKVAAIGQFPHLVRQLKVCWQGRSQHENCGVCEKCLRTRLNFAAAGMNEPDCFPGPFDARLLRHLRAGSAVQIVELESIRTYARRHGLAYPWLNALHRRILASRLRIPLDRLLQASGISDFLRRRHNAPR